ncbi:MAG: IS1096 element passenger TnpR family protein [Bacteroidota bacterium]
MAIFRFRVYWEEDDAVYRDVVIRHTQHFSDLHQCILKAWEFDSKHQATFFRSNEHWQRGREISFEVYDDHTYKVPPLIMQETTIASEIKDPNQHFVYVYDFNKNWTFLIELIQVIKEESSKIEYPSVARKEGVGPSQYGTKGMVSDKLTEIEEKYDLSEAADGFGEEGDEDASSDEGEDETTGDEDAF